MLLEKLGAGSVPASRELITLSGLCPNSTRITNCGRFIFFDPRRRLSIMDEVVKFHMSRVNRQSQSQHLQHSSKAMSRIYNEDASSRKLQYQGFDSEGVSWWVLRAKSPTVFLSAVVTEAGHVRQTRIADSHSLLDLTIAFIQATSKWINFLRSSKKLFMRSTWFTWRASVLNPN